MQVKKHHEKLQSEKEAAGIAKLQAALPKLSRAVLAFALQDCSTDAEKALLVLRQFQTDAFNELAEIQRKRRALRSKQHRQSASDSSGAVHSSKDHAQKLQVHAFTSVQLFGVLVYPPWDVAVTQ